MSAPSNAPWNELVALARSGDRAALGAYVDALDDADWVHAFARLDAEERAAVLAALAPAHAAELLEDVHDVHAAEAVGELAPAEAADILVALPSADRADLVAQLDDAHADAILVATPRETAESVRDLLQYAPDTAGGRMVTEYVAVPMAWTADELVRHLRENVERYRGFISQYVYALGPRGELAGVLPLRDLLLAPRTRALAEVMIREPVRVAAGATLGELFELFERHRFVSIPVVDDASRLVGIVLREDVDEARLDKAQLDEQRSRGIIGGEELRSMPVLTRSGRRLAWLTLNIGLNLLAAAVIDAYRETLAAAIALAVFLPMISDMSGCSGNQAVAVSLRELALGIVRPQEFLRVWWQEAALGVMNGIVLGLLVGLVAFAWKGSAPLAAVVGAALALNTLVAVSIGGIVPLALRRMGFDPALASSPILTTVTDICGFFFALSFATLALPRLGGA
ncbi:MAG: magnesium transporter [Myxococcota bacterium]